MKLFAQITKVDVEKREVWGQAVAEVPDRAREVFDYDSSKPLFEKWSGDIEKATDGKSLGNIRAMHGAVAAGKVIAFQPDDAAKSIDIGTKIVDDAEWKKVEEGVYTGFSIGGKYVKRWKDETDPTLTRYTADPFEISLVDLPCVPTAQFSMIKAAGEVEQRPLAPYGALRAALEKGGLTVGDVLSMAKEYLPDDSQDVLLKAEAPIGDFLEQLRKLTAGDGPAETPAIDATKSAAADAPPADAPPATEASAPAPASDQVGASSAPAQGEAAAVPQADGAEKAATTPAPVAVKKSLYTVSSLADLLSSLRWIASDAQYEKEWEQDDSPIPARLRAWLGEGASILVAMTEEECAELVASLTPAAETVLALSADGDLAKAGARHSKSDMEKLQGAHDTLVALGAMCGDASKSVDGGDLQKRADDAIAKAAELEGQVTTLQQRVTLLEKMPAEGKGVVRHVAVGKEDDTDDVNKQKGPPVPDPKDPVSVMKGIHAAGGRRVVI